MSKRSRKSNREAKDEAQPPSPSSAQDQPSPPGLNASYGVSIEHSYSGPIPPPSILREFDEIVPGAANRLLSLAERQTDHRITLESRVVKADIGKSWAGLLAGVFISTLAIVAGSLLVYNGHDAAGAAIAGAPVASLAGVFVYGTAMRNRERVAKTKILSGQSEPSGKRNL